MSTYKDSRKVSDPFVEVRKRHSDGNFDVTTFIPSALPQEMHNDEKIKMLRQALEAVATVLASYESTPDPAPDPSYDP